MSILRRALTVLEARRLALSHRWTPSMNKLHAIAGLLQHCPKTAEKWPLSVTLHYLKSFIQRFSPSLSPRMSIRLIFSFCISLCFHHACLLGFLFHSVLIFFPSALSSLFSHCFPKFSESGCVVVFPLASLPSTGN